MENIMKLNKKLLVSGSAVCMAAAVATVAITSYAATEHWNDNSGKTAISTEWENWKTEWETVKTDYEKISLTPGVNATQMNFAWYSKTADQAKVRVSLKPDMSKTITDDEASNAYEEDADEFSGTSKEYKTVDEVTYFMKKIFKIRMGIEPINMLDYAADHDDISAKILSKLEAINNKFYSNADSVQVVNAPYLKKAITSSAVTFADFSDLLETMFLEENERLHISILLDFQRKVLNHETHYDSLLG